MSQLIIKNTDSALQEKNNEPYFYFDSSFLENTRNLTNFEIEVLIKNGNKSQYSDWSNIRVSNVENCFNPELIHRCEFRGMIVIGKLRCATLKYHDLELDCGLYNSYIERW